MLFFDLSNSPSRGGRKLPDQSIDFQTEKWLRFRALLCFVVPIFTQLASKIQRSQFHVSSVGTFGSRRVFSFTKTSRIQYRGPKDLPSIVQFYEKTTGFEPVQYVAENEPVASGDNNKYMIQLWNEAFSIEIVKREPYLAFSMLFLCLRLLLSIFGETSQMFAQALHLVDVRRVWTKLRLCKAENLHQGEQSPRVWASSQASVSSGKSSSGPVLGCWKSSSISSVFSPTRTRM